MALTETDISISPSGRRPPLEMVTQSEIKTAWTVANSAPETADNSGSAVTAPLSITRADVHYIAVNGKASKVRVRLKYDDGLSSITDTVVQVFGFDREFGSETGPVGERLVDSSGDHEQTLTTAATDFADGTYKYTDPVEVNLNGNNYIMVAVKTALSGTGTVNNSAVLVRFV